MAILGVIFGWIAGMGVLAVMGRLLGGERAPKGWDKSPGDGICEGEYPM